MINLSLPIRPRLNVRCEYLVTPISVSLSKFGKKILCISELKSVVPVDVQEYTRFINNKIGSFDAIVYDSMAQKFSCESLTGSRILKPARALICTCKCGRYEELSGVRMYSLRHVKNNVCLNCNQKLIEKEEEVLIADIDWKALSVFKFNLSWAEKDYCAFLKRQERVHKLSKKSEPYKLQIDGREFGIRHQLLWACLLGYISNTESDSELVIHYVHKVQDKVFYICALANMLFPNLRISLNALPIVWLENSPMILDCRLSHIKLFGKALNTKRKDVKVSLKSWR